MALTVLLAFVYHPSELKIDETNLRLSQQENVLFVGTASGLTDLDPLYAYDSGSFDVIDQIAEGLFGFDYSDPNLAIVPQLAVDHGTWNGNLYTVDLRQDVEFHDGTHFDAYAVKFTFDRLQYFMDSGMLSTENLYKYYDYMTDEMKPIINTVNVISEYVVEFELNIQYGLFETLLAFEGSFVLSPTSTPLEDIIDVYSGPIIGTGPFVFEYYDDMETSFRAFDNYWNGRPEIDHLLFEYIYNGDEQADLLTSGELHMILNPPTYRRGEFEGDTAYVLDSIESTTTMFIVLNNHFINRDLREAISYAIDYEYLMNNIYGGECARLKSPIPNGIVFSDDSFNVPTTNIIHAREVMQNMGFGVGLNLNDDGAWEASTFLSLNYTYNIESQFREDIYYLLEDNLGKIGIDVQEAAVEWWEFESMFQEYEPYHRDMLQLYWLGWAADYNDPSNFINNLYTNRTSVFNLAQYNGFNAAVEAGRDPYNLVDNVQLLMEAALIETDQSLRAKYYSRIQQLLVEEDFPIAYGYVTINNIWYYSEIQGFQINSLRKLNFLGVTGVPHEEVDTTPPVTWVSDLDGVWGWNGWFQSDVYVSLEAYDDLSGVNKTFYSFDGTPIQYTGPFLIDETKTFYFASIDNNGNLEVPQSYTIYIDKEPPVTEAILSGTEGLNGWFTSEVLVTLVTTDDNSGVAGSGYSFDLITTIPYTGPFTLTESKIFGYGSADMAGNYDLPKIAIVNIDMDHPETTCVITGTLGTGDWYISDVMIELNAFDAISGVDNIEYSFDESTWNDYTDPLILTESGNYEFYFRSRDIAGNIEPTSMVVFEIDKSPSAITEKIIQDLQDLDVPRRAQKDVNKALIDLQIALYQFNDDRFYLGLLKIHNAVKHLMDAQDDRANIQSNIKNIIHMVQDLVETAINVAIGVAGENNRFVVKALDNFNKALLKVSKGQYDKAMIYFKNAYLEASLANCIWKIFMNF